MKQYKSFILVIQVILIYQYSYCGFDRIAQPTSLFSRAFSGTAMNSPDNISMNPASLAAASSFGVSMFYSPSPFQLEQLSNYGFISSYPLEYSNIAIGLSSFGFSLYKESVASLSAAKLFTDDFSAGINVQWYLLSIAEYGSSLKAVFDIGTIYSLSDQINIGFSVQNFTGSSFGEDTDIPRILMSGISIQVIENTFVNFDLVKDVRYPVTYRAGIEFAPHKNIILRSGTNGYSDRLFGGIGILVSGLQINYGVATHQDLGLTHSLGITF